MRWTLGAGVLLSAGMLAAPAAAQPSDACNGKGAADVCMLQGGAQGRCKLRGDKLGEEWLRCEPKSGATPPASKSMCSVGQAVGAPIDASMLAMAFAIALFARRRV